MTAYIKTVCALSIGVGVLSLLLPQSKYKKAFTAFCGVITVYAFTVPLMKARNIDSEFFNFKSEQEISQSLTLYSDSLQNTLNESVLSQSLTSFFAEKGYNINIKVHCKTQDDSLVIETVTVTGDVSDKEKQQIEQTLRDSASFDCDIIFEKE